MRSIKLNNSSSIPPIGFGTWELQGKECIEAVQKALAVGYRHIDTAKYYRNEREVGMAIRHSRIPREEIFVTTKLWPTDFLNPRKAFEKSLSELGLEYVDLYLVHWPVPGQPKSVWHALEKISEEGLAKAIGVSNYASADLEQTLSYATVPPAVNQILFNPFAYKPDVLRFCKDNNIVVEAYSPLTRGADLDHPTMALLSQKYGKTPAQIMIRWCIEHGTVPLPKSSHPDRIKENFAVFDFTLASEDVAALDILSA